MTGKLERAHSQAARLTGKLDRTLSTAPALHMCFSAHPFSERPGQARPRSCFLACSYTTLCGALHRLVSYTALRCLYACFACELVLLRVLGYACPVCVRACMRGCFCFYALLRGVYVPRGCFAPANGPCLVLLCCVELERKKKAMHTAIAHALRMLSQFK